MAGKYARVDGIDRLRKRIGEVQQAVSDVDKLDRFLFGIAEIGAQKAQGIFNTSGKIYAGNGDGNVVSVTHVSDGPGTYKVVATGRSVLFIEFGSGVSRPYTNPLGPPLGFTPGSWSASHQNAIKRPSGLWIYEGAGGGDAIQVHTHGKDGEITGVRPNVWWTRGSPSANAMYEASKDMRASIADAWRQAFGR